MPAEVDVLRAVGVAHHYDEASLFSDVHMVVHAGDRIGLVGPNGAGKSTLLRILAAGGSGCGWISRRRSSSGCAVRLSARWLARPQTRPQTRPPLTLAFAGEASPDEVVLAAQGVSVEVGGRVLLDALDLRVRGGERILLSGRNGVGKTTLLRVLSGELAPDAGAVSGCEGASLLPQVHDDVVGSVGVLDFFRSRVPVYVDEAESQLSAYLFGPEEWDAPLRMLSAGELRRLLLAVMVNGGARVLLLDEPTNYLDVESLDVVEEALHGGSLADRLSAAPGSFSAAS